MPTTNTRTIKSSGGDYTSLSAWEAGRQADLVTTDTIEVAECYAFLDTAAFWIDGWTTGSANYIRITVPAAERHAGSYTATKYRLEATHNNQFLNIFEDYVKIEGLQITQTVTSGNQVCVFPRGSGIIEISSCIIKTVLSGTATNIGIRSFSGITKAWNNVIYDFVNGANACYGVSGEAELYCYNNTIQNCYVGLYSASVVRAKNNIVQDCSDGFSGTFHSASTNNASDISSDAPGPNSQTGSVTFANKAADDFHLDAGDTVAKGNGADLSADSDLPFSTDVDGETRSVPWDIGGDKISTSAQTVSPSGIASAETFGTATVSPGVVTVSPSGIASAETFGTATVSPGVVTVSPSGIASAETFGTATVSPGAVTVSPSAIASAEAFGTATVTGGAITIAPASIASAETFGTATISGGAVTLSPSGITSGEAFGTARFTIHVSPSGIASAEGFGTATLTTGPATVSPSGIASAEAFGTPTLTGGASGDDQTASPSGIASGEAFGRPTMAHRKIALDFARPRQALSAPTAGEARSGDFALTR